MNATARIEACGAVVLCGGRSTRMGRSKAWLPFAGRPLLEHVVSNLSQLLQPLVVVAAPQQSLPPLEATIVRDDIADRGPLQGIATGLATLAPQVTHAFVCAGDAPFVAHAFVRCMHRLCCAGDHATAVVHADGHLQPLAAIYRTELFAAAERLLAISPASATHFCRQSHMRQVDRALLLQDHDVRAEDPQLRSLDNLNTPADYQAAVALLPSEAQG